MSNEASKLSKPPLPLAIIQFLWKRWKTPLAPDGILESLGVEDRLCIGKLQCEFGFSPCAISDQFALQTVTETESRAGLRFQKSDSLSHSVCTLHTSWVCAVLLGLKTLAVLAAMDTSWARAAGRNVGPGACWGPCLQLLPASAL